MTEDVSESNHPRISLRRVLEDAGVRLAENSNVYCGRTKSQRAVAATENGTDIIFHDQEQILHNISQSLINGGDELMNAVLADIQCVFGSNIVTHLSPTHCVDEKSLRGPQQDSICSILLRSSVNIGDYICRMLLDIAASHLSTDHSLSNCNSCITRLAVQHMLQAQDLSSPTEFLEQYMKLVAIIAHDTDMCDFLFISLIRIYPESNLVLSKFLDLWECEAPHTSSILACFFTYANQYKPFHSKLISCLQMGQLPSKCRVEVIAFLFRFCQSDVLLSDVLSHLWPDDPLLLAAIKDVLTEPSYNNLGRLTIDYFCKLDRIVNPFDIALVCVCCHIVDWYPSRLGPTLRTVRFQPSHVISCLLPEDIPSFVHLISSFYSCFQTEFHVDIVKCLPLSVVQCLILQSPKRSHIIEHIQISYQSDFIDRLSVSDAMTFFLRSSCLAQEYYQNHRYKLCHPKRCFEPVVASLAILILKKGVDIRECVQFISDEHLALLVEVISLQPNIDQASPTFIPFVVSEVESAISKSVQSKFVLCAMKLYARFQQKAFSDAIYEYKSSLGDKPSLFALNVTREAFNCIECPLQRNEILCQIWDITHALVAKCIVPSIKSDAVVNHLTSDKTSATTTSRFEPQRSTIPGQFALHSRLFRNSTNLRPLDTKLLCESLINGLTKEVVDSNKIMVRNLAVIMLDFLCDKFCMPMDIFKHSMRPYTFDVILEKIVDIIDRMPVDGNMAESQCEDNMYSQDESAFLDKSNVLSIFCSMLTASLNSDIIAEKIVRDLFIKSTLSLLKVEMSVSDISVNLPHYVISNVPMLDDPYAVIKIDMFVPIFECAQRVNISVCDILDIILFNTRESCILSLKNISPSLFCQFLNLRLKEANNDFIDKILDKIGEQCLLTTQPGSQLLNSSPLKSNKIAASVFKAILDHVCRNCSTNGGNLVFWTARINWLSRLITIAKRHHQHEELACQLVRRVSSRLLPNILSHLIPLIEGKLIEYPHDCLQLLQTLQTCTRFLQHCCIQLRWAGDKRRNLAPLIPKSRRHLELIIYRVQKALRANSMQSAFSCGQLKCRDITGREINSQMSVAAETDDCDLSTQIYDTDSTDMDVDDVPMHCSENSASIDQRQSINSYDDEVSDCSEHEKENVDVNSEYLGETDVAKTK